jgi:hypothetical protein
MPGGPTIASLKVTVGLDDADLQQGLRRVTVTVEQFAANTERQGKRISDAFSGIGQKLTVGVTLPVVAAGAAMIKFASDATESANKVQVVFGGSADSIMQWSKSAATAMGMSARTAQEAASGFGNMFQAAGIARAQSAELSKTMVQLATDLGSMHNIGTEAALEKLRSGLVGEAEPLRTLGVLLTEEAVKAQAMKMGLQDAHGELSEGAKVQARYALILKQTGNAQGDFARTSGEFADKSKQVEAEVQDLAAALGKELLPIAKDVLTWAKNLLEQFNKLDPSTKKLALQVTGLAAAAGPLAKLVGLVGSVGGLFGGLGGAGGAAGGAAAGVGGAVAGAAGMGLGALSAVVTAGAVASDAMSGAASGAAQKLGLPKEVADALAYGFNPAAWLLKNTRSALESGSKLLFGGAKGKAGAKPGIKPPVYPKPPESPGPTGKTTLPEIQDLQYEALLQMARSGAAGGPDTLNAQAEASAVVPLLQQRITQLTARQKALEPQLKTSTDAAKEYYKLTADGWKLQEEITNLQTAAAKEQQDNTKKNQERVQEAHQAYFNVLAAQAKDRAADAAEGYEARGAAVEVIPVLEQKQQDLAQQARQLLPLLKSSAEAQQEYWKLTVEAWNVQSEINSLNRAGVKEEEAAAKKADAEQLKFYNAWTEGRKEHAQAIAAGAAEGERAQASARELVPILEEQNADILADIQSERQDTLQYVEDVKEFWKNEDTIAKLEREAVKEREDGLKKQAKENQELISLQGKLAAEQVKNTIGLTDAQRKTAMVPILKQEYAALMRPVPGETPKEAMERRLEAEGVKGKILEDLGLTGKGSERKVFGGGSIFTGDRRAAQQTLGELAGIERQAQQQVQVNLTPPPAGYPIFGALFQDPKFKQALEQFVNAYLAGSVRSLAPAPGYR